MIEDLLSALRIATKDDLLGYAGVWLIAPVLTIWYTNQVKRTRKKDKRPVSEWGLRGLAGLLAFTLAMFFGNRMAGWSLDKAINQAAAVAFAFPLLITVILDRLHKIAPELSADIGDVPHEFRAADTTEINAYGDQKNKNEP